MTDFTETDALDEAHAIDELTTSPIFDDLSRDVAGLDARIRVRMGMADVLAWLRAAGRAA